MIRDVRQQTKEPKIPIEVQSKIWGLCSTPVTSLVIYDISPEKNTQILVSGPNSWPRPQKTSSSFSKTGLSSLRQGASEELPR
jgi:hypothetical protein